MPVLGFDAKLTPFYPEHGVCVVFTVLQPSRVQGFLCSVKDQRDEPLVDGRPDVGHRHRWQLSLSGAAARHLHGDVRAPRVQHPETRKHPDFDGLHRGGQRRARGGVAAGDRDGHRRLAGHRHVEHARSAELQARSAPGNSELARPLVAPRCHPVGDDGPHRRRRQPRRHADDLHRVRLQRPEPRPRRRHQHDGRHDGRRLLRRLRLLRRSVPRHGRPGRRDADPGRAEPDARQVGRQQVPGRALRRLRNQRDDRREHRQERSVEVPLRPRHEPGRQYPSAQQRNVEVPRLEHQRRRPDPEGQGLVVLLVPQPEDLRRPAELHRADRRHILRHQAVEPVGQSHLSGEPEQ